MIRVLGGPKRLCDGMTRRDLLHVGSLGLLGLGLGLGGRGTPAVASGGSSPLPGFGRAKSCILLYLYGAPSQLETFDPKPDAPEGIRGELGTISSVVPGLNLGEGLPELSRVMDKVTVLRSVTHPYPIHGVAFATTGIPRIELPMELNPRDPRHWPYIGSVVEAVDRRSAPEGAVPAVPRNIGLPWAFSARRVGEVARAGPYGGFLGPSADPVWADFDGEGTVSTRKTLAEKVWEGPEPYRGIDPAGRFRLAEVTGRPPELTIDRLDRRRSLLEQIERARPALDEAIERTGLDEHRAIALGMVRSGSLARAFDLSEESPSTRDLYGMTLFGQASLTARRLVEAGGRFVSVFWDEYGLAGTGWDTHWDHYPRMKDELLPGLDRTLSGLLVDLDRRGLLDETLVAVLSEHGRTPRISHTRGGGRDHWSRCYSLLLAGGGIARGRVVGQSDRIASDPAEHPVSPKDVLATILHLLGIDPASEWTDLQGRPLPLVAEARVIAEALA
ncbi:DUF1501 domain-containing protein [Tautonia sociabilis]|uniref:DUF1501 domain-containing protein n=1 Tax=Tautonia sociabilis TaxID=2080755 RepID=A0A432MG69_9BACT|nr:DUF1501 domain-containing protein [Tautonia sociabilis]RUL85594.1 DUF1501 domain-containing protein [Tautonia sociabilis]